MKKPVFGALSVVSPILGAIGYYVSLALLRFATELWISGPGHHSHIDLRLLHSLVFDLEPGATPICGMIFAIIAGIRREQYPALRWTGFLLNLAIMLLLFLIMSFAPVSH